MDVCFTSFNYLFLQGWAKEWAPGCVNSPPRPEGVRRRDSRNLRPLFSPSLFYVFLKGIQKGWCSVIVAPPFLKGISVLLRPIVINLNLSRTNFYRPNKSEIPHLPLQEIQTNSATLPRGNFPRCWPATNEEDFFTLLYLRGTFYPCHL